MKMWTNLLTWITQKIILTHKNILHFIKLWEGILSNRSQNNVTQQRMKY
jgi:hypothetical protein